MRTIFVSVTAHLSRRSSPEAHRRIRRSDRKRQRGTRVGSERRRRIPNSTNFTNTNSVIPPTTCCRCRRRHVMRSSFSRSTAEYPYSKRKRTRSAKSSDIPLRRSQWPIVKGNRRTRHRIHRIHRRLLSLLRTRRTRTANTPTRRGGDGEEEQSEHILAHQRQTQRLQTTALRLVVSSR